MLEPDWLIGQYKREAGIVNEAGILHLGCRAEVEQKDSKYSNSSPVLSVFILITVYNFGVPERHTVELGKIVLGPPKC